MTRKELLEMQSLPLNIKIRMTQTRIRDWYQTYGGNVYVSFSGGKDSTVLLHLVRELYPDVKAVYCDTGLEYPEIKEFVKSFDNVEIIKPNKTFLQVIKEYGYPVVSKEIALTIEYARKGSKWAIDRLNGKHDYGNHSKYKYLLNAPFKISDKCCLELKKKPFKIYEKETGLKPFIGTMASEGGQRLSAYLKVGCNAFESKRPISQPIGFWTEKDIQDYIKQYNIKICDVYNMGYKRTGCMYCMFGCTTKDHKQKFEMMKETHPKIYDYCMNKLELMKVLEYVNAGIKCGEEIRNEIEKSESKKE